MGVRGARDVELGAFYFFRSKKILAGTDVWTPYIRNLGEQLVMLENLFDDFEGNINWEEDDDEDDLIPPVTNSLMDTAWQMKKKHTEGSYHDLLTLPCSIGHPPHSSASPVELHLRVGPHVLSGKKRSEGERGVEICLSGMLHKGISLG